MSPRIPALVQRLAPMMAIALLVVGAANLVKAQTLPTDAPILLSEIGSTRAFVPRLRTKQAPLAPVVVQPGDDSRVTLYAVNMELLKGEGATAFRAFVEDANRRQVYVTVESVKPTAEREWVYEIVLRLKGEIGNVGDVLVGVTWRGMISNRVRLAIGHAGGGPADDEGAFPTPMPAEAPIFTPTGDSTTDYVGRVISPDRVRFMEQATFGPTADLDVQIRRMGMSAWLADQMTMAYPSTAYPSLIDQPINVPVGCTGDCVRDNYSQHLMQRWFFTDALYGQAQLRRKVSWSLHKLLVISGAGGETQQPSWMLTYLKVLDRNAFGNFRTMLMDMTLNGGMGNYLDMIRSTKNNPNENYAREILQLFSVGLYNLNIKGEVQCIEHNPCQVGDTPSPTYDQNVVNGFTKALTGWNLCSAGPPTCPNGQVGIPDYADNLTFNFANHDTGSKLLLNGVTIPANAVAHNGVAELNATIDNIFNHANVGPFVSKSLIQSLVTSDPTPDYVGRVATVFNNNGFGVRGDMAAVVRAILLDPEARGDLKTDPKYGQLREPVTYMTGILRTFNVRAANGVPGSQSDGYLNPQTSTLSQNVFNPTTVFSYYFPDYIVAASNPSVLGPEFGIMTTTTSLRRANLVNTFAFANVPISGTSGPNGTSIDLSELQNLSSQDATGALLVDTLNQKLMHGSMSAQMRTSILTAVTTVSSGNPTLRAQTALYLVASSSQYQVKR